MRRNGFTAWATVADSGAVFDSVGVACHVQPVRWRRWRLLILTEQVLQVGSPCMVSSATPAQPGWRASHSGSGGLGRLIGGGWFIGGSFLSSKVPS